MTDLRKRTLLVCVSVLWRICLFRIGAIVLRLRDMTPQRGRTLLGSVSSLWREVLGELTKEYYGDLDHKQ
jgi:hypothetical protein